MTGPFILTPSAARDVDEILGYVLEQSGPHSALHVREHLLDGLMKIASHPGMGHTRNDLADESLRVWTVFSYLIVYRPEARPIQIIRILHGARDIPTILETGE